MKDFAVPAENPSKGCGGVMRAAPLGLFGHSMGIRAEAVFEWGCHAAGLTHGHPTGQLPAGFLAMLIFDLVGGTDLRAAVQNARIHLASLPNHHETTKAVDKAVDLTYKKGGHDRVLAQLGEGWVAEEALAISIYCALTAKNFEEGVIRAVNITGDSDSTGAITGNILGAYLGVHEIPNRWLTHLELKECITEIADDLATIRDWPLSEMGHESVEKQAEQDYWINRYPEC
jgi:ADP-ribosylglycohydrolase